MAEALGATIVVVGAGPGGIAAACRAAEAGADTLLLDENPAAGGQIWRQGSVSPPPAARRWLDRLRASGARHEPGVTVVDAPSENRLLAERGGGAIVVEYERLILATGARELFLPFPGWTLPGVTGLGGAQALVKSGGQVEGLRVVVAGSGPLVLPVAATLRGHGAALALVAEQAETRFVRRFALALWRQPRKLLQAARLRARFRGTGYRAGTWVVEARGDEVVREVVVSDGRATRTLACDLLAASYGLVPNLELATLVGCRIEGGAVGVGERLETTVPGVLAVGELLGIAGVDAALVEGQMAGLVAAGEPIPGPLRERRRRARRFAARLEAAFAPRPELARRVDGSTIVCRCEDVRWNDLDPDWSARQAKLYRRAGMGPCQARICGPALRHLCGWEADTVRPPVEPVSASVLATSPADSIR